MAKNGAVKKLNPIHVFVISGKIGCKAAADRHPLTFCR